MFIRKLHQTFRPSRHLPLQFSLEPFWVNLWACGTSLRSHCQTSRWNPCPLGYLWLSPSQPFQWSRLAPRPLLEPQPLRHPSQSITRVPTHLLRRIHPRCDLRRLAVPQVRPDPAAVPVVLRWSADILSSYAPHVFPEGEELGGAASLDRDIRRAEGVLQEADFSIFWCGLGRVDLYNSCFLMYLFAMKLSVLIYIQYVMMT